VIEISSRTAAAELRRYTRARAALRGRLAALMDSYATFADADPESIPEAPQRLLMRDLLAITRAEFSDGDRIAGDGLLGETLKFVSTEEEEDHQTAFSNDGGS
jgi:hypothetical protein